jgi:hypothetical protein
LKKNSAFCDVDSIVKNKYSALLDSLFTKLTDDVNFFNSTRFNDNISLRNPVRNSIVTYNALQKVFRSRFDEGRSNAKLEDFAMSFSSQPHITEPRYNYERLLSKNKENFFNINFYKTSILPTFNDEYAVFSSLNFYAFDFPFLLALKSDASRYLWFD